MVRSLAGHFCFALNSRHRHRVVCTSAYDPQETFGLDGLTLRQHIEFHLHAHLGGNGLDCRGARPKKACGQARRQDVSDDAGIKALKPIPELSVFQGVANHAGDNAVSVMREVSPIRRFKSLSHLYEAVLLEIHGICVFKMLVNERLRQPT